MPAQASPASSDFIPDDKFTPDESKFSGIGQGVQAGLEGALRGTISAPLASLAETKLGLASKEGIRGRAEAHPIASTVGELGGLTAGALTGTGEAAALESIGKGAAEIAGLAAPYDLCC